MIALQDLTLFTLPNNPETQALIAEVNQLLTNYNVKFWSNDTQIIALPAYDNGRTTFCVPSHSSNGAVYTIKSYDNIDSRVLEFGKDYNTSTNQNNATYYIELKECIYNNEYLEITAKFGISPENNKPADLLNAISYYINSSIILVENNGQDAGLSMGGVRIEASNNLNNTKTYFQNLIDVIKRYA